MHQPVASCAPRMSPLALLWVWRRPQELQRWLRNLAAAVENLWDSMSIFRYHQVRCWSGRLGAIVWRCWYTDIHFFSQYYTRIFNMYTYTCMKYHTVHAFVTLRHFDMSQGWQKLWPEQPARMSLWMIWAEIETITTEHKLNICKFSLSVMSSESVNQSTWLFCTIFVHMSSWAKEREIAIHQAHIRIRWFICKSDSLVRTS